MNAYSRWLAALLTTAVIAAGSLFSALALPTESPFAEFRIDASSMDIIDREITVDLYHWNEDGRIRRDSTQQYPCRLNRSTGDAVFFIQSNTDDVWVTVDYLTDINGDGVYELLEDDSAPLWDVMDDQGGLFQPQAEEAPPALAGGQLYILSPDTLTYRCQQAVQARMTGGSQALEAENSGRPEFPLYMVRLHYTDPESSQSYEQTYYLQIFSSVLIPLDILANDWYYSAVEFVLERGYFAGTDSGLFLPNEELSRAQLAQVLWTVNGRPGAEPASFFDVTPDDWFFTAVSWCQQEELISGYSEELFEPDAPLSWEQMIAVLHRYAKYTGASMRTVSGLSEFYDQDAVSSWAVDSMRWAVTNGLISSSSGMLRPGDSVTRAELASTLYFYELNLGLGR